MHYKSVIYLSKLWSFTDDRYITVKRPLLPLRKSDHINALIIPEYRPLTARSLSFWRLFVLRKLNLVYLFIISMSYSVYWKLLIDLVPWAWGLGATLRGRFITVWALNGTLFVFQVLCRSPVAFEQSAQYQSQSGIRSNGSGRHARCYAALHSCPSQRSIVPTPSILRSYSFVRLLYGLYGCHTTFAKLGSTTMAVIWPLHWPRTLTP